MADSEMQDDPRPPAASNASAGDSPSGGTEPAGSPIEDELDEVEDGDEAEGDDEGGEIDEEDEEDEEGEDDGDGEDDGEEDDEDEDDGSSRPPPPVGDAIPAKSPNFRSGFVGLAGAPNVGKSALVNYLIGQKITISTRLPQTTRHRICGILTDERMQAILVDMPGILDSPGKFNEALLDCAVDSLRGSDIILHLRTPHLADGPDEKRVIGILRELRQPIWQVWTKGDTFRAIPPDALTNPPLPYARTFKVSVVGGEGIKELRTALSEALPRGPALYPEDDLSDRDLRFLSAELVREKVFLFLRQEIPYGIATWTEEWEDRGDGTTFVRVVIQTERDSHKGIIIGKGGESLRKIGTAARKDIEALSGGPIFLELWVRVREKWRRDPEELRRLGLTLPKKDRNG